MAAREPAWRQALSAVEGGMSISEAARTFHVARESLRSRLHRAVAMDAKKGRQPKYLSRDQEKEVVKAIAAKARMGIFIEGRQLRSFIRQFALAHNPDVVTDDFPNKYWIHRFVKRYRADMTAQKPPTGRKRDNHSSEELVEVQANETEIQANETEIQANETEMHANETEEVEEDVEELRRQQSPLSTAMYVAEVTAAAAEETGEADGDSQRHLEILVTRMERELGEQRKHADAHVRELQLLQRVQNEAQQTQHAQLMVAVQHQQAMMMSLIKTVAALAKSKE